MPTALLGLQALVEGDDGRITLLRTGNQIFTQYPHNPVRSCDCKHNNHA